MAPYTIPLAKLKTGEVAFVYKMDSGKSMTHRLTSLGFTPGEDLEIVQNFGHGPLMVSVRGTRVALGRGEAAKILVQRSK